MIFKSTRSKSEQVKSREAIINGIARDGGLYVPEFIPKINLNLRDLISMSYKDLAAFIMGKYFTDFEESELLECTSRAYDSKFDNPHIVPLVEKAGIHFLELYHGPTLAFKDMALTLLPHLMKASAGKTNLDKEIVILTATSGDTGKAALEGFRDVDGTKIIVFFPQNGVSEIQKRQMVTQEGNNTYVIGINGNFDDAQRGVKEIFNDREFNVFLEKNKCMLSSANSINIGRLIPQIVYYFHGYLRLLEKGKIIDGEAINIAVPTGNFGNILAAYYAREMGLPINKLICASNENNVLYDFLVTGVYDKRRELKLTSSPSMDILVSSNLERLLYEISGRDEALINSLMERLNTKGVYEVTPDMKRKLDVFYGGYALEAETMNSIRRLYEIAGYIVDTHTAVAYSVYEKYKRETRDNSVTIIASTASPYKFGRSVLGAIGAAAEDIDDFEIIHLLSKFSGSAIPEAIGSLENKRVIHSRVYERNQLKDAVKKILMAGDEYDRG